MLRHLHTCTGHKAALYTLAPGRNDRHFLTAGGDGWIVEWNLDDPDTGNLLASVGTQLYTMCSLPEQQLVIAGNMNGGVHWIHYEHPDKTRNVQHHQKGVYDILAVGERVFTAGGDGLLTLWDRDTGHAVESYHLSNQALRSIAYSEKRQELAVGSSDGSVYLLDSDTLFLKKVMTDAHQNSIFTVLYSPNGKHLLTGGRDAMLRIWKTDNLQLLSEQNAHWYTINHVAFSPDQAFFATASRDKTIKIWDAETFSLLKVIETIRDGGHINSVNRLLWLPDCLISVSDDRSAMLWSYE